MDNLNNNKGSLLTKFLQVFIISVVIFSLIVGVATGAYMLLNKPKTTSTDPSKPAPTDPVTGKPTETNPDNKAKDEKQLTTFAVFGVDKDGWRTDVTMVMTFNHVSKEINIVSIPRDTLIDLPTDIYNELKTSRSDTPKKLKINGVPAYAPKEKRNEYSVRVLETLFDLNIDYYVKVNLSSFRKIVDIIGPIEFEVPFDMEYSDPHQDLYINIKKGKQSLNGAQAEQLIRYRKGYGNGDIGRIDMQHEFMKAFMNELLTDKNKLNMISIGTTVIANVDTNFMNILDYVPYINDVSTENLHFHGLPGTTKDGSEYFYYDAAASKLKFKNISQVKEVEENTNGNVEDGTSDTDDTKEPSNEPDPEPTEPEVISSKSLKIEVLNSTKVTGLAGRTKEKLQDGGFTVTKVGNYRTEALTKTKIIIPNEGMGEDLSPFFKGAVIELDSEAIPEGIDIRIIIGSDDGE